MQVVIPVSEGQLVSLRQQCHSLFDLLNRDMVCLLSSIDDFSNLWARVLGYKDWESLVNQASSSAELQRIITPDTLCSLAIAIRQELGQGDVCPELLELYLLNVLTPDEKRHFLAENYEWDDLSVPEENAIHLELGPVGAHEQHCLFYMWPARQLNEERFICTFLNYCKAMRKGGRNDFDIYPKKQRTASDVIDSLIKQGYLSRDNEQLLMSDNADWFIRDTITQSYGEDWQAWFGALVSEIEKIPNATVSSDWTPYILCYRSNISPVDAAMMKTWGKYGLTNADALQKVVSRFRLNSPGHFLFHFRPRLFLAPGHTRLPLKDISCAIKSTSGKLLIVESSKLRRPYPNTRYVVATSSDDVAGFFIDLPLGTKEETITTTWSLPGVTIVHQITFLFPEIEKREDHLFTQLHLQQNAEHSLDSFYAITDYLSPQEGQSLQDAAANTPRLLYSQMSIKSTGDGLVDLNEIAPLEYIPYQQCASSGLSVKHQK